MLATALVIFAVGVNGGIAVLPVVLFGVTVVGAEHRDRLFGDETSVSGTIVVGMTVVVAFSRGSWLLGPTICCALAGIYWPHLRQHAWSRIAINTASMALAAGAAAAVFQACGGAVRAFGFVWFGAGVSALLAFWIVNSVILGVAVAIIRQRGFLGVCLELVRSDTGLLPFAVLGLIAGYVVGSVGLAAGWLLLLTVLVALDVVVIRAAGREVVRRYATGVIAMLGAVVVLAFSVTNYQLSITPSVVLVVIIGILGVLALQGVGAAPFAIVMAAAATAMLLSPATPIAIPAVLGIVLATPLVVRGRTPSARSTLTGGIFLGLVALVGSIHIFRYAVGSVEGDLAVGLAAGLAALCAWHLPLLGKLLLDLGIKAWPAALDDVRSDGLIFTMGSVSGALAGWAALKFGTAALALVLLIALGVCAVLVRRRLAPSVAEIDLGDDDVLDAVRGAVLDLPASRVPDR